MVEFFTNINLVIPAHERSEAEPGPNNNVQYLGLGPASATLRVLYGMTG